MSCRLFRVIACVLATFLFFATVPIAADTTVDFLWSGAITAYSARVKVKVSTEGLTGRLAFSPYADFRNAIISDEQTAILATNGLVLDFRLVPLRPNRRYFYAPSFGGVIDTSLVGQFRTLAPVIDSFTIAMGSCAWTGSNHSVFETIRSLDPLMFLHMGDMHYQNIGLNDVNIFRSAFDQVLASPTQSALYRQVPIAYIWDDHDYGPNNSDSTAPGRLAARLTYQEYVPHYPLAAGSGNVAIYHAFSIGKVRFIMCDSRSARSPHPSVDNASKTMLGVQQKAWFKQELLEARDSHTLIVWISSLPWIGVTGDDGWYLYTNERRELADFIKDNNITNLCMLSGDAHMLAIDDGTNSDYATGGGAGFPVMHAASLHRTPGIKGGPYSHGAIGGIGQFGLMTVVHSPESVFVSWSGRNELNQELIAYSFAYSTAHLNELRVEIQPNPLLAAMSETVRIFRGRIRLDHFPVGFSMNDIDTSTIVINGHINPIAVYHLLPDPNSSGDVLAVDFDVAEMVAHYMPFVDSSAADYTVSGWFGDSVQFEVTGQISLVGHISGDTNGTGEVDISDLTNLVAYLFNSSPPAIAKQSADMDHNGQIDISDLTLLVGYMFDRP